MPQLYLTIRGLVQGVFFRSEARKKARELGIKGWVRNTEDGAVEIAAQAEEENLNKFIVWCRRGPRGAKVDNVEIQPEDFGGRFEDFRIDY